MPRDRGQFRTDKYRCNLSVFRKPNSNPVDRSKRRPLAIPHGAMIYLKQTDILRVRLYTMVENHGGTAS